MGWNPIPKRSFATLWLTLLLLSTLVLAPAAHAQDEPPDAGDAVSSLEAVQEAVIQIEAVGSFVDPGEGMQQNVAGSGSGFLIDPAGIAVTNNHVVTGAAFLRVYLDGQNEPLSARVLGVSECADLAVIDLRGDGFPYLEWYDGPIRVGLDVYAAGFPLGDPEFTLTRGIVAKARAEGETPWASVEGVIQHDATINPGNSGGPLVDGAGRVVAVNFAGDADTSQYLAIGRDGALDLVERLREGNDIDALGLNGQALLFDEETDDAFSGIWVASVASGSPADEAGIQAGDFILSLEGISLATDGTMSSYCDILRSHDASDTLNVELYRSETDEFLSGQINGRALAVVDEAEAPATQTDDPDDGSQAGTDEAVTYDEYVTIGDESGRLTVDVPAAWDEIDGSPWIRDEEEIGVGLTASPDVEAFFDSFGTPGLFFGAREDIADPDPAAYLDDIDLSESCTYDERAEYDDEVYVGVYDTWTDCGEAGTLFLALAALPADGSAADDLLVYLELVIVTDGDVDALQEVLSSFLVDGEVIAEEAPAVEEEPVDEEDGSDNQQSVDAPVAEGDGELVAVSDSFGMISVELPVAWADLSISPWTYFSDVEEPVGVLLEASTDLDAFYDTWDTPGLLIGVSRSLVDEIDAEGLLDNFDQSEECDYEGREPYESELFTGLVDTWTNCLDAGSSVIVYAGVNEEENYLALVPVQIVDEADRADVERALGTLEFGNPNVMDAFLRSGDEPELVIEELTDGATGAEDEAVNAAAEDEATGEEATGDELTEEESAAENALLGSTLVAELALDDYEYEYEFFPNAAVNAVLPSGFTDTLLEDWVIDGDVTGQIFSASSDIKAYEAGFDTPGARFYVSTDLRETDFTTEELLDIFELSDFCDDAERYDHEHEIHGFAYEGVYDIWSGCGENDGVAAVIAVHSTALPDDIDEHVIIMEYVGSDDADREAFSVLLASYFHDPATAEAWAEAEEATDEAADDEAADDEAAEEASGEKADASGVNSILAGIGARRETDEAEEAAPAQEVDEAADEATDSETEAAGEATDEEVDAGDDNAGDSDAGNGDAGDGDEESAADGVVLALNLAEGGVYRASTTTEQIVSQELFGTTQTTDHTSSFDYSYTVNRVDADGNLSVSVRYGAARYKMTEPDGSVIYDSATATEVPAQAIGYAALVGNGFDLELSPSGEVLAINGVDALLDAVLEAAELPPGPESDMRRETLLAQFGEEVLVDTFEQSFNIYPDGPVAVGDSWSEQGAVNYGFAFLADITWTLVDRADGVATVEVTSTIESDPDAEPPDLSVMPMEMALTGEQSGTLLIDEATGWVLGSTLTQSLTGSMRGEDTEVPMSIQSTITTVGSVE